MSLCDSPSERVNGRWTQKEHKRFLLGLQLYGKNWKKIEELVETRNGSQIRSHAQKFFLKVKKTVGNSQNSELPLQAISETDHPIAEEKSVDHSFFMSEVLKKTTDHLEFNFWQLFVDINYSKIEGEINIFQKKESFSLLEINEAKQQIPSDFLGIVEN